MLGRCGRVQLRTVVNRGIFMEIVLWLAFLVIVIGLLALDLGVLNRKAHVISTPEALGWTAIWVILALVFNVAVYYLYEHHLLGIGAELGHELNGRQAALLFFTGYLVEKSLSLDNIFVIALIFAYFRVPAMYQHRVLFWGILGALVLRGAMILAGAALIRRFDWIIYVFGALLILTAVKMLVARHDNLEPNKNPLVKLARRLYPVSPDFEGSRFFTRLEGRRAVTPLFLVLLVVESSDVLFAVDSIPAIFAVTTDPFIVFTSNVFAILGLRSLYFVLAGIMDKFRYLKMSLVFLLAYIGVKMLLSHHYPIPTFVSGRHPVGRVQRDPGRPGHDRPARPGVSGDPGRLGDPGDGVRLGPATAPQAQAQRRGGQEWSAGTQLTETARRAELRVMRAADLGRRVAPSPDLLADRVRSTVLQHFTVACGFVPGSGRAPARPERGEDGRSAAADRRATGACNRELP